MMVVGLGIWATMGCGTVWAQTPQEAEKPQRDSQKWKNSFVAQMMMRGVFINGSLAPRPDIARLEPRLRDVVKDMAPEAKVEVSPFALYVSYQSDQYATHLLDHRGVPSQERADKFSADFGEFWLSVRLASEGEFPRVEEATQERTMPFGTIVTERFDLRGLFSRGDEEVPVGDPAYIAYDCLARAGVAESRFRAEAMAQPRGLTRYEFACTVRALRRGNGEMPPPVLSRDLTEAVTYLQARFAAEIYDLESPAEPQKLPLERMRGQRPHEYLALEFSYGKGVPPVLVEKLKSVVREYAAEQLKKIQDGNKERMAG